MPKKILAVDDDPDILEALTMILESQDYQVVTATDGVEGLANLKTEMPDLMILDLLMPKMDGFAVCKELQDPRVGKVPEDTYLNSDFGERGSQPRRYELETRLELDVDDYVEKPFSPDILLERVARLVKKKEGG